jgi:hypothetical protein
MPVLLGLTAIVATRTLIDTAASWHETLLCAMLAPLDGLPSR